MNAERIVAAAIKMDGVIWTVPAPGRHHDVIRRICEMCPSVDVVPGDATQGFVTDKDRFVDRTAAAILAILANQVKKDVRLSDLRGRQLYSEDLW